MFDWNDVRYFLTVAREGSMGAAAKALGVNQSTVQRRLGALERAIGRALVERSTTGYVLTDHGHRLLSDARQMESVAGDFQRRANALDGSAAGHIKVTSLVTVGQRIIKSGFIDRFQERHPGIEVEMVLDQRVVDLARGEADIAIRGGAPGSPSLICKKIADLPWAIFASIGYVERYGRPSDASDLARHRVVELVDQIEQIPAARWLRSRAPGAPIAARCGNIPSAHLAVRSGAGIGALPYVYAVTDKDLVCVLGPVAELNYPMYLLVHKDMRKVPRISEFFRYCAQELKPVLMTGKMKSS